MEEKRLGKINPHQKEISKIKLGGQAVIEGVMIRSQKWFCIAIRKNSGEIVLKTERWFSFIEKYKFLKLPVLRGCVVLWESLHNGIAALSFSAKENMPEKYMESKNLTTFSIVSTIIFSFFLAFFFFAVLPHFLTWFIGLGLKNETLREGKGFLFHIVDGFIKVALFLCFIYIISKMKDIQRVFQYHGAEHKSVNAYENGEELNVENLKKYSTIHPRCGTTFIMIVIVISIIIFAMVFPFLPSISNNTILNQLAFIGIKLLVILPIAGLCYEIIKLSENHSRSPIIKALVIWGLLLQKITTKEPDDNQLEVAIVAVKNTFHREINKEYSPNAEIKIFNNLTAFEKTINTH